MSGGVVCSSDLRVSACISEGCSAFPVVSSMMCLCILVKFLDCLQFEAPQLKRSESRGLLSRLWSLSWASVVRAWNENDPECQTNKHSLIRSASVVNCTKFCELACIINYHTKNVRAFVLSREVTCTSFFLFVAVPLLDRDEHQNAYAERDDVCRKVVGRNCN